MKNYRSKHQDYHYVINKHGDKSRKGAYQSQKDGYVASRKLEHGDSQVLRHTCFAKVNGNYPDAEEDSNNIPVYKVKSLGSVITPNTTISTTPMRPITVLSHLPQIISPTATMKTTRVIRAVNSIISLAS